MNIANVSVNNIARTRVITNLYTTSLKSTTKCCFSGRNYGLTRTYVHDNKWFACGVYNICVFLSQTKTTKTTPLEFFWIWKNTVIEKIPKKKKNGFLSPGLKITIKKNYFQIFFLVCQKRALYVTQ